MTLENKIRSWKEARKDLQSRSAAVRKEILLKLIIMAIDGYDISPLSDIYCSLLFDENSEVAHNAAVALHHVLGSDNKAIALKNLTRLLKEENAAARRFAADALQGVAWGGVSLKEVTPAIKKTVSKEQNVFIKKLLINALTLGYLNDKDEKGLVWLLTHKDFAFRDHSISTLRDASYTDTSFGGDAYYIWHDNTYYTPRDIGPAVPALKKALKDENEFIRKTAREALDNYNEGKG